MKKLLSSILMLFLFTTTLNGGYLGNKAKKGILSKTTSSLLKKKTTQKVVKGISSKTKDALFQHEKKKIFKKVETKNPYAPNGTRTVYQRDIDENLVVKRTIKGKEIEETNLERMKKGLAPHIKKKNGETEPVELHHSRQENDGSLFELGSQIHRSTKSGQGAEALHPYKNNRGLEINNVDKNTSGNNHPEKPINREMFALEKKEHWQNRAKEKENLLGKRIGNEQ